MENPKISVIVPIYNAEKYLHRCVDSILSQTFKDFEVLLINDGSTDGSGVICEDYALQDSRIRVFHKENGGVSSARNVGIKNMVGEYSIHVDSDDWVLPSFLQSLYSTSLKYDAEFVFCDYMVNNDSKIKCQETTQMDPLIVISDILSGKIHGSTWNKLLRNKKKIFFNDSIGYCEDVLYNIEYLLECSSVHYINEALYVYCPRVGSITNASSLSTVWGFFEYLDTLEKTLGGFVDLEESYNRHVLNIKYVMARADIFNSKFIRKYRIQSNRFFRGVYSKKVGFYIFLLNTRIYVLSQLYIYMIKHYRVFKS